MIRKEKLNEVDKKNKSRQLISSKYVDEQTGSDTPKKTCFKLRFIQWLKQLPLDERYLAVKVNAPGLSKHIQESLIYIQNDPSQQEKKDSSVSKKINIRQAKQIIDSIVLISDGDQFFDSIGFDFTYVEYPDKFYELLVITLSPQEKQMFQTEQYQIQPFQLKEVVSIVDKCQTKEQLALTLIDFFRAELFLKFQEKRSVNLEEEKTRKKEFSMYWRNLSQQNKKKLLMLSKQDFSQLSNFLAEKKILISSNDLEQECNELLQMQKNEFCNKIFKCKLRKSLKYYTDYHELIYKQWKSDLNKKKRRARNRKPSNAEKPSTSLNRGTIIQINQKPGRRINNKNEKEHEKVEKKVEMSLNKEKSKQTLSTNNLNIEKSSQKNILSKGNLNTKNHTQKGARMGQISNGNVANGIKSSVNLVINLLEKNGGKTIINNSNQNKGQNYSNTLNVPQNCQGEVVVPKKRKNRNKRKKSVSAESKETNTTNHRFEKEQRKIQDESSLETLSPSLLNSDSTLACSLLSSQREFAEQQTVELKNQIFFPHINYSVQIYSKLQNDIQEYSDLINEEANEFYERRVIAYERIQFMLGMWKIPIKLFGSCASGITIKNSDIDIAVDNSILNYFMYMPENTRLKGALQQLQQLFQQQPWVTGLKLIKTAAIPLIKMKVNTSIKFVQMPGTQLYQPYIDALNRDHLSSGEIHIDLTIQTINKELQSNHLGVISTNHINNWLKSIKSLHPIVIIIKNYLTKTNLNITYEGGLNTYSMICMLVAFIKENKLEEDTKVVHVLEKLLKFYAFQFDEKTTGIDLLNLKAIFQDKIKLTSTKSQNCSDQLRRPNLEKAKSEPQLCQADLLIKDPLNNGKNMTKNCYSFPKIKEILEKIYKNCFEDQTKKLQQTFKELFKQRWVQTETKNPETETQNKEIRELLEQCKLKLGNPFLTLFE